MLLVLLNSVIAGFVPRLELIFLSLDKLLRYELRMGFPLRMIPECDLIDLYFGLLEHIRLICFSVAI